MSERFTPERLEELRRIAEAATPGNRVVVVPEGRRGHEWFILQVDGSTVAVINKWARSMSTADYCDADAEFFATFDPPTVLAMLDEIERLWRGREVLVEAVRAMKYFFDSDYSDPEESATVNWSYAHQKWLEALALLDGEKGRGEAS